MPCSKCHGTGHNAATCAASPGARGAAASGAPRVGGAAATPERHCSTCHKAGHNRATCPNAAAASPASGAPAAGGAPAAPDADDLGGLAAALGGADIGGAGERASDADLLLLHAEELRDICEHRHLPAGGSKSALVERLVASRIKYRDLVIDDLKDVLHALKLPVGGRKAELVARLVEHNRAGGRRALPPLDRSEKPAGFEGGPMSRATYRARMKDLGMGAMADQDVCHIISVRAAICTHRLARTTQCPSDPPAYPIPVPRAGGQWRRKPQRQFFHWRPIFEPRPGERLRRPQRPHRWY
jgi:hypothetical protein